MEVSGYQFKHIQTVKQLNDIINSLTYAFSRYRLLMEAL